MKPSLSLHPRHRRRDDDGLLPRLGHAGRTSQEQTGTTASALTADDDDDGSDDGPGLNVFTLSVNADGFVSFVNSSGAAGATLTSATKYKAANLNQFIPGIPCAPR